MRERAARQSGATRGHTAHRRVWPSTGLARALCVQNLAVDRITIGPAIAKHLGDPHNDRAFAETTVAMARSLHLDVVEEPA
jgi:hypothetical protein